MGYTIEYGPKTKRVQVNDLRTDTVMGMYHQARSAGEIDIQIFTPQGEEADPHQLALDLRSGISS